MTHLVVEDFSRLHPQRICSSLVRGSTQRFFSNFVSCPAQTLVSEEERILVAVRMSLEELAEYGEEPLLLPNLALLVFELCGTHFHNFFLLATVGLSCYTLVLKMGPFHYNRGTTI